MSPNKLARSANHAAAAKARPPSCLMDVPLLARVCVLLSDAERMALQARRLVQEAAAAGGAFAQPAVERAGHAGQTPQPTAARTEDEPVCATSAAPSADGSSVFRRAGDFWIIAYQGTTIYLRDAKGLRYLAHLLRHPHREFHALDLVAAVNGNGPARLVQQGIGPPLDERTRAELRQRWQDLRTQLEEAEQWNDQGRIPVLKAELESIEEYVRAGHGLCGRPREEKLPAEQARQAVTKGIASARRRSERHHPALGHHLIAHVKTGFICAYVPGAESSVSWRVE